MVHLPSTLRSDHGSRCRSFRRTGYTNVSSDRVHNPVDPYDQDRDEVDPLKPVPSGEVQGQKGGKGRRTTSDHRQGGGEILKCSFTGVRTSVDLPPLPLETFVELLRVPGGPHEQVVFPFLLEYSGVVPLLTVAPEPFRLPVPSLELSKTWRGYLRRRERDGRGEGWFRTIDPVPTRGWGLWDPVRRTSLSYLQFWGCSGPRRVSVPFSFPNPRFRSGPTFLSHHIPRFDS